MKCDLCGDDHKFICPDCGSGHCRKMVIPGWKICRKCLCLYCTHPLKRLRKWLEKKLGGSHGRTSEEGERQASGEGHRTDSPHSRWQEGRGREVSNPSRNASLVPRIGNISLGMEVSRLCPILCPTYFNTPQCASQQVAIAMLVKTPAAMRV